MSDYKEKIVNIETGEELWRDYTPAEVAQMEKAEIEASKELAEQAKTEAARQSLLDRLGITEEEAKLLLG